MKIVDRIIFFMICFIISFVFLHSYADDYNIRKSYLNESTSELDVENYIVNYETITLKQKLAQMIIVKGDKQDLRYTYLNVGGIFLDDQNSIEKYKTLISKYKSNSKIDLFVTTDLEGAWNPFMNSQFEEHEFKKFSEVESAEEAYNLGVAHSRILEETGFNFNFAPVAEFTDNVYGGRVFHGTKDEILSKIGLYIQGLKLKKIFSTCKHYPGRALEENLHLTTDSQEITSHDLDLFNECYKNNVSAIMVSHQTVTGVLDSNNKPSSVSREIVSTIDPSVLIISDEVNMVGLTSFYEDKTAMYIDLINSGNDLILDFELNSLELYELLISLEKAVNEGKISEERIDESVKKILYEKGYFVR